MANLNEAYDLELFQPREPRLVAMENNKKIEKDKHKRTRKQAILNVIVYLSVAILALGMIAYFITCNVQLTEMNKMISDYQTQLSTLQSERARLESELASKTSAEQIDRYAQENNMLPAESSQIYYIPTDGGDLVSVAEDAQGWLQRVWENLRRFLS